MTCKQECEVFSRVVGYYRPVQQWNKGKQAEFAQRKAYNLSRTLQEVRRPESGPRTEEGDGH